MDFWGPYLFAMRERAPKMFKELCKSDQLDAHVRQKAIEAEQMYEDLVRNGRSGRTAW